MTATRQPDLRSFAYVAFCYLAGVIVAASYGKIGPVAVPLQHELGLGLGDIGWAISAVDVVSAVLGAVAGVFLAHRGSPAGLAIGLAVVGVSSLWLGTANGFAAIIGARVLEGAGYLLVVSAAPSLITLATQGKPRRFALSLWATFVPVGLSIAAFAGSLAESTVGWRIWFEIAGVVVLIFALVATLWRPARQDHTDFALAPRWWSQSQGPLITGIGFSLIVAMNVTVISLFPIFLTRAHGMSVAAADGILGVLTPLAVPGGLLTGALLQVGGRSNLLAWFGLVMPIAGFLATNQSAVAIAIGGFGLFVFVNGFLVAVAFSMVPTIAPDPRMIPVTYGIFSQLGGFATLLLPPLLNGAISKVGWSLVGPVLSVLTIAGILLLLAGKRRQTGNMPIPESRNTEVGQSS